MTLNKLVEVLEKLKTEGKGDYEVVVHMYGYDDAISVDVDETRKQIIL